MKPTILLLLLSLLLGACSKDEKTDPIPTKLTDGKWIRVNDNKETLNFFSENEFMWTTSDGGRKYSYTLNANEITYTHNDITYTSIYSIDEKGILSIFNGRKYNIKW